MVDLPGAVFAEQREHFARPHVEIDVAEHGDRAVLLADAAQRESALLAVRCCELGFEAVIAAALAESGRRAWDAAPLRWRYGCFSMKPSTLSFVVSVAC